MKTPKIAILGAGFCGLAAAYYLTQHIDRGLDLEITLFDPGEIGANASGISAGMLHPYAGAQAKRVQKGIEGQSATLELAAITSEAVGVNVADKTGLLRMAISAQQKEDFYTASTQYENIRWCEAEECQKIQAGIAFEPGIFIENAYVIKTKLYLEGLWLACNRKGVKWNKTKIETLTAVDAFDVVIVAGGAHIIKLPELAHLPIYPIKGQILEIAKPKILSSISIPVSSSAYLVQGSQPNTCFLGATFERNYASEATDVDYAIQHLEPKLRELFPSIDSLSIVQCQAGLRASAPGHLPIVKRESEKVWILSGMGSKGLLYHAIYAKELVNNIISGCI